MLIVHASSWLHQIPIQLFWLVNLQFKLLVTSSKLPLQLRADDCLLRGLKWSKLLDPDKKGQWWLSGDASCTVDSFQEVASKIDLEVLEAQKLLQLAAAQRMNTDARRAIFCVIMSGEDYLDAFEKILRLDLPGKQVCMSLFFLSLSYLSQCLHFT